MDGSAGCAVEILGESMQEIYEWKITACASTLLSPYSRHFFNESDERWMLEMHPKSVNGWRRNILSVGLVYLPEQTCAGGVEYSIMLVNQSRFEESIIRSGRCNALPKTSSSLLHFIKLGDAAASWSGFVKNDTLIFKVFMKKKMGSQSLPGIEKVSTTQSSPGQEEIRDRSNQTKTIDDSRQGGLRSNSELSPVEEGHEGEKREIDEEKKDVVLEELNLVELSTHVDDKKVVALSPRETSLKNNAELEHIFTERMGKEARLTMTVEEQKLLRVSLILDKLTFDNCTRSVEKVHKVGINTTDMFSALSNQIFQKAVREPHRSEVFAIFCRMVAGATDSFRVSRPNGKSKKTSFKRICLNKLQTEFEAGVSEQGDVEGMREGHKQIEEDAVVRHRNMVGCVTLVGELYNQTMLPERRIHECIKALLRHMVGTTTHLNEETADVLCELLYIVGKGIDNYKNRNQTAAYMKQIKVLSKDSRVSDRIRIALKDVVKLRESGW